LTPGGAALWAKHIQRVGNWREWQKVTEIEVELARELAQEEVNWGLLERLTSDYAAESGRLARLRRQGTVDTALRLSGDDRKAIGAFLKRRSQRQAEAAVPPNVLSAASEFASGFYRSFGLSAEGAEMLIEAAREEQASDPARLDFDRAIGEHLSRDEPDPRKLNDLVDRLTADETRLARSEKSQLIRVAGRLTLSDRQRFGRAMADAATESLNSAKPVLEIVP
jgi:hypothetical protein